MRLLWGCILFLLLSCTASDPDVQQENANDVATADKPQIVAMLNNILQDWEGQDVFIETFEQSTGVGLEIIQPPHQSYSERVFIQLLSDRVPDIIEILPEYLPQLVNTNMLRPLNEFIDHAEFAGSIHPEYIESVRHPSGAIFGIPARDGGGCVAFIRKDWLDNLGMSVPRTLAELEAVMHAFTYGDPNRSGRHDTFAYTDVMAASQDWYNRLLMRSGHVQIHFNHEQGQWIDGFTTQETRAGLIRLKDWYDKGYIDPDIATNTTFSARSKFINGQAGIFTYWANHWARNLQNRTSAAAAPDAEVLPISAVDGSYYIKRIAPVLSITTASTQPELVFRSFIDRQFDQGEIQTLFTFGVEGYHWERNDGVIRFKGNPQDPFEAEFTRAYVPPGSSINGWESSSARDTLVELAIELLNNTAYYERQPWGGEFFGRYFLEIEQTLKPRVISMYLSGDHSLEQTMAYYRQEASRYYLDEVLDELNTER